MKNSEILKRKKHPFSRVLFLAENEGLRSLPAANTNWLSLQLKLSRLKTVHRTVFFTASALPGSNPSMKFHKEKCPPLLRWAFSWRRLRDLNYPFCIFYCDTTHFQAVLG